MAKSLRLKMSAFVPIVRGLLFRGAAVREPGREKQCTTGSQNAKKVELPSVPGKSVGLPKQRRFPSFGRLDALKWMRRVNVAPNGAPCRATGRVIKGTCRATISRQMFRRVAHDPWGWGHLEVLRRKGLIVRADLTGSRVKPAGLNFYREFSCCTIASYKSLDVCAAASDWRNLSIVINRLMRAKAWIWGPV